MYKRQIQAAVLRVKLKAFREYELSAINERACWYNEALKGTTLKIPLVLDTVVSSWAQSTVQLPEFIDRDRLQAKLKEVGVPAMVYYPKPMHEQKAFEGRSLALQEANSISSRLCCRVLSLPIDPYADIKKISTIITILKAALNEK